MLKLLKPASPEDLFMQRYDLLMGWALGLTSGNRAQAEDLVHDAFIQFTLRRAELGAIENTDAYLNRMLRNMYLSQIRRATLVPESSFSISSFDSAEIGLRSIHPRDRVDVQDDLRQICQYACARKEASKAGCVLILRFFHSYYPSEIAQILRTSRKAVDRYLMIARREVKLYLSDPRTLKFTAANPPAKIAASGYVRTTAELLAELRTAIFASRTGECAETEQFKKSYAKTSGAVDVAVLSHVVSCPRCLDTVNRLLGLPVLAERNSDDRLGRDVPPDSRGGAQGGPPGASALESKRKYERRLRETIEHRPHELCIAVNGFVLGAQEVSSEFNKQVLSVNIDEPIGFIEVFSEQGFRLLFFDVDQPIDGSVEQTARAEFDCGRALDLSLNFRGPWPSLNVSYRDPTFDAVEWPKEGFETEDQGVEDAQHSTSEVQIPLIELGLFRRLRRRWSDFGLWTWDFGLLFRPGTTTAVFALISVALVILVYRQPSTQPVSAADLLQRAAVSEELVANNRDHVLHRTLRFEEKSATGELIASRRIDIWHSSQKGITARRLYDESGSLIAGDWRRADGVQTIYHHGKRPQLQLSPDKGGNTPIIVDDVWQLDLSASQFNSLIDSAESAQIQETTNAYLITYQRDGQASEAAATGLMKAVLALSKTDLHATELTITIAPDTYSYKPQATNQEPPTNRQSAIGNRQWLEFRFIETSFERRTPSSVAPAVFEPETGLLGSDAETGRNEGTENVHASPRSPIPASPLVATAELEVEVLRRLNDANALFGEQVGLSRTLDGRLRVQGIVETEKRKKEIIQALSSFKLNPAVHIQVETVSDAEERQARQRAAASGSPEIGNVEVEARSAIPAEPELRAYLSRQRGLSGEDLDQEVRRFADRIVARTRQARRHALALKQIAERLSPDDLQGLDQGARTQWRAMIAQHARAIQQELDTLRRELQPVFPSVWTEEGNADVEIAGDADLARAGKHLFNLVSVIEDSVSRSFSIYASGNASAPVKTAQFSRTLRSATTLAQRITRQ